MGIMDSNEQKAEGSRGWWASLMNIRTYLSARAQGTVPVVDDGVATSAGAEGGDEPEDEEKREGRQQRTGGKAGGWNGDNDAAGSQGRRRDGAAENWGQMAWAGDRRHIFNWQTRETG